MAMLLNHECFKSGLNNAAFKQVQQETFSNFNVFFDQISVSPLLTSEPNMRWDSGKLPALNDSQFAQWQSLLESRTGMYIDVSHRSLLESSLTIRMREIESSDYDEYYKKVCSKPDGIVEWNIFLDRVLVKETRFYRNPESLSLVSKHLGKMLQEKDKHALNIWSVGCSSGEEAYTLAILCEEAIKANKAQASYGVTATDISLPVLAKAREGIYNARRLLDLKTALIDSYFTSHEGNKFQVVDTLKKKVCFSMSNMIDIEKSPLRNMDIIYCQNVLIYFKKERKHIILDSLVERLAPGGLLVIGQGEAFGWHNNLVTRVADNQTLAYIRQATHEH